MTVLMFFLLNILMFYRIDKALNLVAKTHNNRYWFYEMFSILGVFIIDISIVAFYFSCYIDR